MLFKRDYYAQQRIDSVAAKVAAAAAASPVANNRSSNGSSEVEDSDEDDDTAVDDAGEAGEDADAAAAADGDDDENSENKENIESKKTELKKKRKKRNSSAKSAGTEVVKSNVEDAAAEDVVKEADVVKNGDETVPALSRTTSSTTSGGFSPNAPPFVPQAHLVPAVSSAAAVAPPPPPPTNLFLYSPASNTMIPCEEIIIPNPVMGPEGPVYQGPSNIYLAFPAAMDNNTSGGGSPSPVSATAAATSAPPPPLYTGGGGGSGGSVSPPTNHLQYELPQQQQHAVPYPHPHHHHPSYPPAAGSYQHPPHPLTRDELNPTAFAMQHQPFFVTPF